MVIFFFWIKIKSPSTLHSLKAVFYTPVMLAGGKRELLKILDSVSQEGKLRTGEVDQHVKVLTAMPGSIAGATG